MKQRILVLDATSFIGSRLAQALAASEWATPVLVFPRGKAPKTKSESMQTLELDMTNSGELRSAIQDVSCVANCALPGNAATVSIARAIYTANARAHNVRKLHLSSIAVYGNLEGRVNESTRPADDLSPYASAKLEAERLAGQAGSIIIRPGIVYGPGSIAWSARIAQLLHSRRLGDLGKLGDGCCNLVYIDDLVSWISQALREPTIKGRIYNVATPEHQTWNEYFVAYARELGAVPAVRIGKRQLAFQSKILAPPQKLAEIIVAKTAPKFMAYLPQPMPPSLIRLFQQRIKLETDAAEVSFPVRWTLLTEGLRHASIWYEMSMRKN